MAQTSDPQEQGDQLFRDVATHTTVPVSCCDRYFRYVWVSDAQAEMLGSTKSKMEGRLIPDVIGRPAFERLEPYMRHALEGRTVSFRARVPYSRVGWRCIDATYAPTFDPEGKATGWVATITDTTRQSELEKSLESLKTESEAMLATLQHELRNPLAAITYGLEALLRITAAESWRAFTMPVRSPLSSVTPALSIATSAPVPMAMPTSAAASAGASFTPSPAMATTRPSRRNFSTTAFF